MGTPPGYQCTSTTDNKESKLQITIDTNNLSELDIAMLGFLAGQEATEEAEPEAPASAPAKATAPAKKAAPKAEPAPEPEDEDLVGSDGPTMADAVARATQLISEGEAAKVKAILNTLGAKKVSDLAEDQIPAFFEALDAE